jgi:adenosylhomocysteinase
LIDDGGDMHVAAHIAGVGGIVGGSEETTSGVVRLRALEADGKLAYPVIAVNNARTKFLFDNRFGTGQSTFDGILRATSMLLAGKKVVVVGYGWVGKGVAERARGLGCHVTIVEVDPIRALEAHLDGYELADIGKASTDGDIFISGTGQKAVIPYDSIREMRDGAVLVNAGHFDVEIDVRTLFSKAKARRELRPNVTQVLLEGGKRIYVLGEGRVANLVAAEGHPPEVMQMSFANQLMAAIRIRRNHRMMEKHVYGVDDVTDLEVAHGALASMGIRIDRPAREQAANAEARL